MLNMTMMLELRLPQCPVCRDNWATDDQVMRAKWAGVGSKFGICCCCQRLVHSIDDPNYKRRWTRWYKKHPADQDQV